MKNSKYNKHSTKQVGNKKMTNTIIAGVFALAIVVIVVIVVYFSGKTGNSGGASTATELTDEMYEELLKEAQKQGE